MRENKIKGITTAILFTALLISCTSPRLTSEQEPGIEYPAETDGAATGDVTAETLSADGENAEATASSDETIDPEIIETTAATTPAIGDAAAGEAIAARAQSLIGTPFVAGGDDITDGGFDNSGFIYYVLQEQGYINCPRGVQDQFEFGTFVDFSNLSTGDLVFFSESGGSAEYGGVYVGGGNMVSCPYEGQLTKLVDITAGYYRERFFGGTRVV